VRSLIARPPSPSETPSHEYMSLLTAERTSPSAARTTTNQRAAASSITAMPSSIEVSTSIGETPITCQALLATQLVHDDSCSAAYQHPNPAANIDHLFAMYYNCLTRSSKKSLNPYSGYVCPLDQRLSSFSKNATPNPIQMESIPHLFQSLLRGKPLFPR